MVTGLDEQWTQLEAALASGMRGDHATHPTVSARLCSAEACFAQLLFNILEFKKDEVFIMHHD